MFLGSARVQLSGTGKIWISVIVAIRPGFPDLVINIIRLCVIIIWNKDLIVSLSDPLHCIAQPAQQTDLSLFQQTCIPMNSLGLRVKL